MPSNGGGGFEKFQYFYHPDHLGSTSYVTDQLGQVDQHYETFPFGEAWVEEATGQADKVTPYRFTGKEWDSETQLYYFGARYYDPRTSLWVSMDPALGPYLSADGTDGIYGPVNLSLASYSRQRPLIMTDPDGRCAPHCAVGALAARTAGYAAVGGVIGGGVYLGRAWYTGESWSGDGLRTSMRYGAAIGATASVAPVVALGVGAFGTGYMAGSVGDRASRYGELTPEEQRGVQFDAALTVFSAAVTVTGAAKSTTASGAPLPSPRRVGSLQGGPLENATQVSGRFNLENGPPGGTVFRADNKGNITSYATYDASGHIVKRVDVTGAAHNGIPTPHVLEYGRNTLPDGSVRVQTPRTDPRPATPKEIP
jgi:RHS repeat-associated protein